MRSDLGRVRDTAPTTPPVSPSSVPDVRPDPLATLNDLQTQIDHLHKLLAESQRLATIGTIAAVIAHEFNNLLTPVVSYSQYALQSLRSGKPDATLIEKALVKSAAAGEKAGRICGSMLGLARGQGDYGPVEVMALVEEVLSVLARDPAKDGIALRVQVTPGLKVVGDMVQLEQVLLNLLINARQAMLSAGRGGSLTVRAEPDEPQREAVVCVSDTGPGIAAEHLPRIFEPFFTTKASASRGQTRGTGLGLSICKQIVETHRGTIAVESALGKGTTFTVRLPLAG